MIGLELNTQMTHLVLRVPWFSQLEAKSAGGGAGAHACLLMLLHFYQALPSGSCIGVEDLFAMKPACASAHDLVGLAAKPSFNLSLMPFVLANVLSLREHLLAGRPIITLVNYDLLDFEDHLPPDNERGNHWLVVVGYEYDEFVLHDPHWLPLQRRGRGGAYRKVHYSTLHAALARHQQPNAVY